MCGRLAGPAGRGRRPRRDRQERRAQVLRPRRHRRREPVSQRQRHRRRSVDTGVHSGQPRRRRGRRTENFASVVRLLQVSTTCVRSLAAVYGFPVTRLPISP